MIIHKELTTGRWFELSLVEQLANVGSDVIRAINWKKKGNNELGWQAFVRALELIDLTVEDPKNRKRLKEVLRMREVLVDYYAYDNQYKSTDESWYNYFYAFNYAAALRRGK